VNPTFRGLQKYSTKLERKKIETIYDPVLNQQIHVKAFKNPVLTMHIKALTIRLKAFTIHVKATLCDDTG